MKRRYTKIVATLGPATATEKMLTALAAAGMDVARINFSHGTHDEHRRCIERLRTVNKKHGFAVTILQDLEGHRIRVGKFARPIPLIDGKIVTMSVIPNASATHIPFDFDQDVRQIPIGADVFIDDGTLRLTVVGHTGRALRLRVIDGGILKPRKGINIPQVKLIGTLLSTKDAADLSFGIAQGVDVIAQSFVRNKADIERVTREVRKSAGTCQVIAKIENQDGVRNIDGIIGACDLGVSLPIYQIPLIQKYLIRRCNRKKKAVMVATQMLDSMIEHNRPTRAEVSDVANAIIDGADHVMLSGETAVGKYPVEAVTMMRQIIEYTEQHEHSAV